MPTATVADRISRLRAFEFHRALLTNAAATMGLGQARGWPRSRAGAAFSLTLFSLYVWITLSQWHGQYVQWAPLPWTLLALPWLLWGLAAAIPVSASILAGMAWTERYAQPRLGLVGKSIVELLPLSTSQVLTAKLQGRGAAFLLALVVGFALLVATRALLVSTGAVLTPPPLLDPWLLASVLLFCTMFLVGRSYAVTNRALFPGAGASCAVALVLALAVILGLPYAFGVVKPSAWTPVHVTAVAAALAGVLSLLSTSARARAISAPVGSFLTTGSSSAPRPAADSSRWAREVRLWHEGWRIIALYGLGDARSRRHSRDAFVALIVGLTALLLFCALVMQVVAFASDGGPILLRGGTFASALAAQDRDVYATTLRLTVVFFALAMMVLAGTIWPEFRQSSFPGAQSPFMPGLNAAGETPHFGLLLPVDGERLWSRRLRSILLLGASLGVAAIVTHFLAWVSARLICGPLLAYRPTDLLPLLGGLAIGLCIFAWVSIARPTIRALPLSGCIVAPLLVTGGVIGITYGTYLWLGLYDPPHHGPPGLTPFVLWALCLLWVPVMLLIAHAWSPLENWHVAPDGRLPSPTKLQAAIAWIALLPTTIAAIALSVASAVAAFSWAGP